MNLQNVLNYIIDKQGVQVSIRDRSDNTDYVVNAAISNYFRMPGVEEGIESSGRQYVISKKDLQFTPERGDAFTLSSSQYFSIADVQEMVALGEVIGYRLVLK